MKPINNLFAQIKKPKTRIKIKNPMLNKDWHC